MTIMRATAWVTNAHLIEDVAALGYLPGHVLDPTFGKGTFWNNWQPEEITAHDLYALDGVDFRDLPEDDATFDSVCLDPPYKLNGTPWLPEFDERYGTDNPHTWQERHTIIKSGMSECTRVLKHRGYLSLKCMDQVCSGAMRWQTFEFYWWAVSQLGLQLVDRFDYLNGGRWQDPERGQVHARANYSTPFDLP